MVNVKKSSSHSKAVINQIRLQTLGDILVTRQSIMYPFLVSFDPHKIKLKPLMT